MQPFRPKIATYVLPGNRFRTPDGQRVTKATPGAVRLVTVAKDWYGRFTDADGVRRRVRLASTKQAAAAILAKLVLDASLGRHGLAGPAAIDKPVEAHLLDWQAHLETMTNARGHKNTAAHVRVTVQRARRLLAAASCRKLKDLAAGSIERALAGLNAVHGDRVLSPQSRNCHLQAVGQFVRWLLAEDRLAKNPLNRLHKENVSIDQRRKRRAFSLDELGWLLDATAASARIFRGLSGPDRDALYRTALATGFRAAELASLTPGSFDLAAGLVNLRPEATKDRRGVKDRHLPGHLVELLRRFLAGTCPTDPIWPGTWKAKAAYMLARDLEEARLRWRNASPDLTEWGHRLADRAFLAFKNPDGEWADFHALRHTFVTQLLAGGADPKAAQVLARHKDQRLTMQRYAHAELQALADAIDGLPDVQAPQRQAVPVVPPAAGAV